MGVAPRHSVQQGTASAIAHFLELEKGGRGGSFRDKVAHSVDSTVMFAASRIVPVDSKPGEVATARQGANKTDLAAVVGDTDLAPKLNAGDFSSHRAVCGVRRAVGDRAVEWVYRRGKECDKNETENCTVPMQIISQITACGKREATYSDC